jgi:ABC-type sugar transport system permease subunit
MTMGGPIRSTEVITYKIYVEAFKFNKFGYASSLAVLLSVVVCSLGMLYLFIRDRNGT